MIELTHKEKTFLRAIAPHADPFGRIDYVYWADFGAKIQTAEANDLAQILVKKGLLKFLKQDVQQIKHHRQLVSLEAEANQMIREWDEHDEMMKRFEVQAEADMASGMFDKSEPTPSSIRFGITTTQFQILRITATKAYIHETHLRPETGLKVEAFRGEVLKLSKMNLLHWRNGKGGDLVISVDGKKAADDYEAALQNQIIDYMLRRIPNAADYLTTKFALSELESILEVSMEPQQILSLLKWHRADCCDPMQVIGVGYFIF